MLLTHCDRLEFLTILFDYYILSLNAPISFSRSFQERDIVSYRILIPSIPIVSSELIRNYSEDMICILCRSLFSSVHDISTSGPFKDIG